MQVLDTHLEITEKTQIKQVMHVCMYNMYVSMYSGYMSF